MALTCKKEGGKAHLCLQAMHMSFTLLLDKEQFALLLDKEQFETA